MHACSHVITATPHENKRAHIWYSKPQLAHLQRRYTDYRAAHTHYAGDLLFDVAKRRPSVFDGGATLGSRPAFSGGHEPHLSE